MKKQTMRLSAAVAALALAGSVFATSTYANVPALKPNVIDLNAHVVDHNAPADPIPAGEGISAGDDAYIAVSAATLWTDPDSPRRIDKPALGNPVRMADWNSALKSTEDRKGLTGRTQTQAIYGDRVHVFKVKGDWAFVGVTTEPNPGDKKGYEAWVPLIQLVKNNDFAATQEGAATAVVTAKTTRIETAHGTVEAPLNTRLPVADDTDSRITVDLPDGTQGDVPLADVNVLYQGQDPGKPKASALIDTAKQFVGLKYLWGGTSAYGFDCSGFTYSIYRAHGITIPRDSGPQSKAGKKVKLKNIKRGDLVFFATRGGSGSIYHVGMYIGDGKMIHAPNASRSVEIVKLKSWGGFGDYAGVKRFL